jgi:hypothetical protein
MAFASPQHMRFKIPLLLCTISFSTALFGGCVSDNGEESTTDPDQSDGKGDDGGNCSTDEYKTYLRAYLGKQQTEQRHNADGLLALSSAAQGNPCPASDDAYVMWLAFAKQLKLDATEKRVSTAVLQLSNHGLGNLRDANDYQAYATALTLTADEHWLIDSWNLVKPPAAGKKAIAAWSEYYGKYVKAARTPLMTAQQIFERVGEITSNESTALDALSSLRPLTEVANSYQIWSTTLYLPLLESLAPSTAEEDLPNAIALLKRIAATRPAAHYDVDEAFFLTTLQKELDKTSQAGWSNWVEARLTAIGDTNPHGGGSASAKGWLSWLGNFISNTGNPTALQKSIVEKWLAVKPCAVAPELEAAASRVSTALKQSGFTTESNAASFTPCSL